MEPKKVENWSDSDVDKKVSFRDPETGLRRNGIVTSVKAGAFAWIDNKVCLNARICDLQYES